MEFNSEKSSYFEFRFKWWQIVVLLFVFAALFILSLIGFVWWNINKSVVVANKPIEILHEFASPTPTPDPLAPYVIVLLGYGGANHQGGNLTDTMMAAYIQPRKESVTLISIPRDLWINLPVSEEGLASKINAAFSVGNDDRQYLDKPIQYTGEAGGGELVKYAVETVTGLPVKYFVAVSFDGFEQAIDSLGGLEIEVPVTFEDKYYPIKGKEEETCGKSEEEIEATEATLSGYKLEQQFECRYEVLQFEKGLQTLDGETALKYVRSRHSETYGNDFNRSERQQTVLLALKNELLQLTSLSKLPGLISRLSSFVITDISPTTALEIVNTHGEVSDYSLSTINLNDDNVLVDSRSRDRQYILIPKTGIDDWNSIHQYIQKELTTLEE